MATEERSDNLDDPGDRNHGLAVLLESVWRIKTITKIERMPAQGDQPTNKGWRVYY